MNWIDLVLLAVIAISVWNGARRGFIVGILELANWIGSLFAAFYFYKTTSQWIEKVFPSLGVWTYPVAFFITLMLARLVFSVIINMVLGRTTQEAHAHNANRTMGTVPGLINGLLWATILSAFMLAIPISDDISAAARKSKIAGHLGVYVEWLDEKFSPVFDPAINKTVQKLTVKPGSEKSVKLPFSSTKYEVREDLEQEMLLLINEERRKEGLEPLTADAELREVARDHSRDMFARGYFSHISPDGKTPAERIRSAKVRFLSAGENLALGPTIKVCHTGLMNSPGHRANILHKAFGRVGIGVLDGGRYGLMITQNFRN